MLPWSILLVRNFKNRWTLTARDVCFTKPLYSWFFSHRQCVPVVRGDGVYQRAVNFTLDKLNENKWVHIYPEGLVNETHVPRRLKWGVGRMIADSDSVPTVIPFWHSGMDDILPNKSPYIPQIRKKVTVLIGKPIDFKDLLSELRSLKKSPEEIRKVLTDSIQSEMRKLQVQCEILHQGHSKYSNS